MDEKTDYEKFVEGINTMSNACWEFYMALKEKGFGDKQAMELTSVFLSELCDTWKPKK